MSDSYRSASAHMNFLGSVHRHRKALAAALQQHYTGVDKDASMRTLVRLARANTDTSGAALHAFETAVRSSLVGYLSSVPKGCRSAMDTDAQFLVEHFDRFTEVPVTANPIKRVVIWARRKLRGAAKVSGDVD